MKIKKLLFLIAIAITLISCAFTEEIHVKNDGSGTYNFKIDMSEMMQGMKEMGTKDTTAVSKIMDTTFFFKDILEEKKDSVAKLSPEDQASLKSIEDMNLHLQVDDEKGKMLMDFGLEFKDISEVKNIEEKLSKAMAVNKKKAEGPNFNKSNVAFSFDGKNFSRKTILKKLSKEEEEKVDTGMKQSSSFLEGSTYKLIYHFEKKIKNVSFEGARISEDGKTLTIEVPMDSLVKHPQFLDFKLKLK